MLTVSEAPAPATTGPETVARARAVREAILNRRSIRAFTRQPVADADLLELVEAGVYAPSASNAQNQRFLVLTDRNEIERLGRQRFVWPWPAGDQARTREPGGLLARGTALILVFIDALENDRRPNGEYHIWQQMEPQNAAAAIENILLLATAKGLGACWVSASETMSYSRLVSGRAWRTVLSDYDIPPSCKIQGIVVLGYPKRLDDHGYARGEAMHGATVWQETSRRPLASHLIRRRGETPAIDNAPAWRGPVARTIGRLLALQLRAVRLTDWCLWRLEAAPRAAEPDRRRRGQP